MSKSVNLNKDSKDFDDVKEKETTKFLHDNKKDGPCRNMRDGMFFSFTPIKYE